MMTERKTALVTGASSGIGAELARIHAEHGGDLIVVARRRERLESLKTELEAAHGVTVHVLPKDLTQAEAPQQIHDEVRSLGVPVDYLVNNAGFGYRGFFHEQDWAINEAMIKVNILALAALTRLFVPDMVARHSGRILNIGSMAGFLPGPLQFRLLCQQGVRHLLQRGHRQRAASHGRDCHRPVPGTDRERIHRACANERCQSHRERWPPPAKSPRSAMRPCSGAKRWSCRAC